MNSFQNSGLEFNCIICRYGDVHKVKVAMNTLKPLDITTSTLIQETANDAVFPVITRKDINRRRVLVSRTQSVNTRPNVPAPGHEYDFRRTPDPGRTTPRRGFHGQIRPCIPPDTADLDALRLNMEDLSPPNITYRNRRIERLDVARCPTPMPAEEPAGGQQHQTPDTARTAWTSVTNNGGNTPRDLPRGVPVHTRPPSKHIRTIPDSSKDVVYTDVESECVTPAPSYPVDLTEDVLNYYYQRPVDKDRRIVRWIADCEEKSKHLLPAHLPNIAIKPPPTVSFEDL